jgi:hypothetical protein
VLVEDLLGGQQIPKALYALVIHTSISDRGVERQGVRDEGIDGPGYRSHLRS